MPKEQISALNKTNFFFILGAQKSGTTWLSKVLNKQPDVFIQKKKNSITLLEIFTKERVGIKSSFSI